MNKQYKIEFFRYPGCIVVCNALREEYGDYEQLAHIDYSGLILWLKDRARLPEEVRRAVNNLAAGELHVFRVAYMTKPYIRALSDFPDCFWIKYRDRIHQAKTTADLYRLYMSCYLESGRYCLPEGVPDPAATGESETAPAPAVCH